MTRTAEARFAGIACGVKNTGIGNGVPEFGHAILRPESDGSVTLFHSWTEMGQGVHTVLRQIACEELGLPPDRVRVVVSTERELDTGQTTASRSTVLGGNAVLDAARKLNAALDGRPLETLAGQEFRGEFVVDWTTANDAEAPVTHFAYAWATQVVTLDDDGRLAKVIAAHDVGRAINPTLVEGQIEGAVHMGLGQALSEEFVVEGGVPLTETLKSLHIIPPTGMPRGRVRPRRGAAARGPVRRQGHRRSSARPHRGRSRGRAARVRRHPQDATPDEGLARGARGRPAPPTCEGADMILTGATVVTSLDPVEVDRFDIHVRDGRIVTASGGARRDCSGCLVVPGNVCAHTHLYSALARGMPYELEPPKSFVQILQRVWWRLDRALDEESVRASALVGGMEALLSGTTTLVDHHASPNAIDGSLDVVADALAGLGVRSVLCYETSDRDGPERALAGLAENVRFAERVQRDQLPLARGMIGAHASFTLSDETLAACAEAAKAHGVGVHVHAAEDAADERDAMARYGVGVAQRLARAGALDARTLLAHGVHLGDEEIALVHAAGASLAHNARSNMNNAIGRARLDALGAQVALGTDGIGSDMFEESRTAYFRLREEGTGAGPDWALARLAEGARLAGRAFEQPRLGRIETGAPADLVVLDYAAPAPLRATSFAGHWIFGLSSRWVRDVMVAGEWAVLDRRLARVDQQELADGARVQAERLWKRLEEIGPHPFEPKGGRPWPLRLVTA